jgi:hypothetical protein
LVRQDRCEQILYPEIFVKRGGNPKETSKIVGSGKPLFRGIGRDPTALDEEA